MSKAKVMMLPLLMIIGLPLYPKDGANADAEHLRCLYDAEHLRCLYDAVAGFDRASHSDFLLRR
jgi:hypothetical protein